jgi:hypothetical protein
VDFAAILQAWIATNNLQVARDGVTRSIGIDEFAAAFRSGWIGATSVFVSMVDTSRNRKK